MYNSLSETAKVWDQSTIHRVGLRKQTDDQLFCALAKVLLRSKELENAAGLRSHHKFLRTQSSLGSSAKQQSVLLRGESPQYRFCVRSKI